MAKKTVAAYPPAGKAAPAFTLPGSNGKSVKPADFKGRRTVVLFFYPRDNTSGCTREACGFRDGFEAFKQSKNQADELGNSQILGPDPFFDDLFCRAAKKAYVTCERIVETQKFHTAGCIHTILLDRSIVSGVVEAPFGAHPTSCAPDYGIDEAHLKRYSATAKGEGGFESYYKEFIVDGHDAYVKAAGGADQITALPLPVF